VILTLAAMTALALRCAPGVAPETLLAVARVESGFDPLVVAVNGKPRRVHHPPTAAEAAALASRLIATGKNVDLGLGQINSRNLRALGLSLADAFDPCRNLAAAGEVLETSYKRSDPAAGDEQAALRTALSFYNTGDPARGVRNGYVARVARAAATVVPALAIPGPAPAAALEPGAAPSSATAPPPLDVFSAAAGKRLGVF
jgi:type IV secretion system protein VirB1